MEIAFTIEELKGIIKEYEADGDGGGDVSGIASLKDAQAGDLSFLGNMKYKKQVGETQASVVILPKDYEGSPRDGQLFLRVEKPSFALAMVCKRVEEQLWPKPKPGVHSTAVVEDGAQVAETASVGAFCYIGKGAKIGGDVVIGTHGYVGVESEIDEGSWVMPRVVIGDYCKIGKRVRLHSGVVLGSDGFGYDSGAEGHVKEPQVGNVVVGDDVEIGANTTIDRARFSETVIGEGTKIDNLVQIGHNVRIGKHCLIVSQTGVSGSTVLEDGVILGGQVGVGGHLVLGAGSMVGSQSGLNHDLEPKSYVRGAPVYPFMVAHRLEILKKRLPELFKRVSKVEEVLEALKQPV